MENQDEQEQILGRIAQGAAQNPPQTDAGQQLLGDLTDAEQQVRVNQSAQNYNLVPDIDPDKATEIGKEIQNGFKDDDDTRDNWLEMHTFWLNLYMQNDYAQNSDPERSWGATESVPILTESCDQFQSRTYKAFFPNEEFVSAVPVKHTTDPVKRKMLQDRAERVGRHMSWQLGVQNRNYKKDKRALFLGVALHGSYFTKTYFDSYKKLRPCIDNIRPTDLVVNYNCGPVRIEDVRRKTHIIRTTVGETARLVNSGFLFEAAKPDYGDSQTQYDEAVQETSGILPSNATIKRDHEATLLEQQFFLDIDDSGVFLPYLGTIDMMTGKLLRLTIDYDSDKNGMPTEDYEQIQYYTHYKFSENPDGFYGLGLGHKIGDLNGAVNIGVRQMLDAATLANDGNSSGFISSRLCLDGEDQVVMTIGKFRKIPDTTGDLKSGLLQMQFPGPSDAQFKLIEMLDQRAQRIGSTTEATTGSIDKNMQPTTVLAQIEQGLEMFSSVQMGLSDDLGDELHKVYKLNQKYMPLVEYFTINDTPDQVTQQDYADDMVIEPIFDPKFATRAQKVARAEAEIKATMENPMSETRPWVYDVAFRRYLQALDTDNVDELVPPTQLEQLVNAYKQAQAQQSAAQGPPVAGAAPGMAGGRGNGMGNGAAQQQLPMPGGVVPNQVPGGAGESQLVGGIAGSA